MICFWIWLSFTTFWTDRLGIKKNYILIRIKAMPRALLNIKKERRHATGAEEERKMKLRDILVHVGRADQSRRRVEIATNLAATHEAHLSGLFVRHAPYMALYDLTDFPPEVLEMQAEDWRLEEAKAAELFADTVAEADISHEWICAEGPPHDVIIEHARFCDLLVIGQGNQEAAHFGDLPGSLILSAGRPVLVVPPETAAISVGHRVMVGWDASAPAARALNDALPLLAAAEEVDILAVNPDDGEGQGEPIRCEDVGRHLARHGIKAETQSITVDDVGVADLLLSRAADRGIDLFVMGAYGHPRWRELVLGGVTAHMLENMTMPVLMAH